MRNASEINAAYAEYVYFAPVLDVADKALDRSDWSDDAWEAYGEHIGEIAMERALYAGSSTSDYDAKRIYDFTTQCDALRYYAQVAPLHAEACHDVINMLRV